MQEVAKSGGWGVVKGGKNAKHRQPGFYLRTTSLTRLMRRVCHDQIHQHKSGALYPFQHIDFATIKVFYSKNNSSI